MRKEIRKENILLQESGKQRRPPHGRSSLVTSWMFLPYVFRVFLILCIICICFHFFYLSDFFPLCITGLNYNTEHHCLLTVDVTKCHRFPWQFCLGLRDFTLGVDNAWCVENCIYIFFVH